MRLCPNCSANPITATPIWKWEFENKEHPIRGFYMTFFEKFLFKFLFSYKRLQMGQNMYFYQLYKLYRKSSINPVSVCKWEIAPFPLQSILSTVFSRQILFQMFESLSIKQQNLNDTSGSGHRRKEEGINRQLEDS